MTSAPIADTSGLRVDARVLRLLATHDFRVAIDPAVASVVERWLPRVPTVHAAAETERASCLRVIAATDDLHAGDRDQPSDSPSFSIGGVHGWPDAAAARTRLTVDRRSCVGAIDLDAGRGEVRVATECLTELAEHDIHSMLAVASAMLILRLGGFLTHAGAIVAPDGRAWLLIGDSHAGKTTTCLNLIRAGWDYLSDDNSILFVDAERGEVTVEGWPRLFHVDTGWRAGTPHGRRERFDPLGVGPGQWRRTAPLAGLLFPTVDAAASTVVRPLAPVDALAGIIRQSPWVLTDRPRGAEILATLSVVARYPAYALRLGLDTYHDVDRLLACLAPVCG